MSKLHRVVHFSMFSLLAACTAACTGFPQSNLASSPYVTSPQAASFSAASSARPVITLDARSQRSVISGDVYGGSVVTWFDFAAPFVNPSLRGAGIHLIRFPGGSESDAYHWENGGTLCDSQGYIATGSTFERVVHKLVQPLHVDAAVTLNYGSNRACNGGGAPSEAGAWVAYSKAHGHSVQFWTVGNEVYGSWEYDLHSHPHDPVTYAQAVRSGYYPAVKKADPTAKLGVVVDTPNDRKWNDVVLRQARPFDFVELHYYPEYNTDNDAFLLGEAIDAFAKDLTALRAQMNAAGVPKNVPIYVGEYNGDAGNEGKQSVSIVNGLFLGQMLGTFVNAGVPMSTWWLTNGSCDQNGDFSKSLYGWQNFGSEAMFSDGLPDPYDGCNTTPSIPGGTPFPTARVMAVFDTIAPPGSQVRAIDVPRSLGTTVRAYGVGNQRDGYGFALFNNTLSPVDVTVRVKGSGSARFVAVETVYGKAQYDLSRNNRWAGSATTRLGTVPASIPLTLQPYSVTALKLAPH